jgi:phage terminase large subunit GpA-like protein
LTVKSESISPVSLAYRSSSTPDADDELFDLSGVERSWVSGLLPDPDETVSEWSDGHRILSAKGAAEPGPWRTSRTPYLRAIMDRLSARDPTEIVAFCAGAQLGKTEGGNNWLGYIIHRRPGPTMMVQPTLDTVKRASRQRIEGMIADCPELRARIGAGGKAKDKSDTLFLKEFPGGILILTGANSGPGLRSAPVQYLFLDEVDRFPLDVDGEGAPIDLAIARTRTFRSKRKILMTSTPMSEGTSVIWRWYLGGNRQRYWMPCPHRNDDGSEHWITFDFENLKWTKGNYDDVHYECPVCGKRIVEAIHKTAMLAKGEWRTTPGREQAPHQSFHLSSLYSPVGWFGWDEIAQQSDDAEGDIEKKRVFVNTVLALPFADVADAPDWEVIYSRRGTHSREIVPPGFVKLTGGGDVGQDHVEASIWAWGRERRRALIDWIRIDGPYNSAETWRPLRSFLDRRYELAAYEGVTLGVDLALVDCSEWPAVVRKWIREQGTDRIGGVIGRDGRGSAQMITSGWSHDIGKDGKRKRTGGMKVVIANVSAFKAELMGALAIQRPENGAELPPGWVCLPHETTEEICKQLTGERQVREARKGAQARVRWEQIRGRRVEALDCHNYARAAAILLGAERWRDSDFDYFEKRFAEELEQRRVSQLAAAAVARQTSEERRVTDPVTVRGDGDHVGVETVEEERRPNIPVRKPDRPQVGVTTAGTVGVRTIPMPKYKGLDDD